MVQLDQNGLVLTCPECGQRNRIAFGRLTQTVRCGNCKTQLPPLAKPIEVQRDGDFFALIGASPMPVLADFWANWCGPCKMVAPELEKVAARNAGSFLVIKIDTERVPSLSEQFRVNSIPTLILFTGGSEVARVSGARPAAAIEAFVQQAAAGVGH